MRFSFRLIKSFNSVKFQIMKHIIFIGGLVLLAGFLYLPAPGTVEVEVKCLEDSCLDSLRNQIVQLDSMYRSDSRKPEQ